MILGLGIHPPAHIFNEINDAVCQMTNRLVVFNAHNFTPPKNSIVFNLENLTANPHLRTWPNHHEVWDFNRQNLPIYPPSVKLHHVPIGYHPSMERFKRSKELDIDVVFCGSMNERRERLLNKLRGAGVKVKTIHVGPVGHERNQIFSRARLAINLHYYMNPNLFESVRVSHLIANRVPVITEDSTTKEEETWGLVGVPYERMFDRIIQMLSKSQQHLEEVAEIALENFKKVPFTLPTMNNTK